MYNRLNIVIGRRVQEKRKALGLTRERLVDMASPPFSSKYLWEIEKGKKMLSADMLRRLAVALNVTADWLLDLTITEKGGEGQHDKGFFH
ncbi:MAG: helix-turn-helix domain-containing protein [Defluviitaleaceae bacterium]|nr:helix-turn-helix domain-containing protein [Defluviitaleaceae bacterium]